MTGVDKVVRCEDRLQFGALERPTLSHRRPFRANSDRTSCKPARHTSQPKIQAPPRKPNRLDQARLATNETAAMDATTIHGCTFQSVRSANANRAMLKSIPVWTVLVQSG